MRHVDADEVLELDDPLLPAAVHLVGDDAHAVVGSVLAAAGGRLVSLDAAQVAYRPGREMVVQYRTTVAWRDGRETCELILAGATPDGAPAGTVVVRADDDGSSLEVGVWRYPFDPELPGLAGAVDAAGVARLVRATTAPALAVVSYRPCRRAVIRAEWLDDTGAAVPVYVKVVPPSRTASIVRRHEVLRAAGIPAPEVVAHDTALGLVALSALPGRDLRDQLVAGGPVPDPAELASLVDRIAEVTVDLDVADGRHTGRARADLLAAAPKHAAALAHLLPGLSERLGDLVARLSDAPRRPATDTIHGDLHEAQVRVDAHGSIVGLLDVDDLGPGDRLDDLARCTGHLVALACLNRRAGVDDTVVARCDAYAVRAFEEVRDRHGVAGTARVAAALVGLATVPFRLQGATWREDTVALLDLADTCLADTCLADTCLGGADETNLISRS
jgi:hypothetical protein